MKYAEKKRIFDRWIADLESGEFKQCQEKLHDGTGFCCLGVLANQHPDCEWKSNSDGFFYPSKNHLNPYALLEFDGADGSEIATFAEAVGLAKTSDHLSCDSFHVVVADLNDDDRSFESIAAYLRKNEAKMIGTGEES